ncbi:hypothetical protein [Acidithrix sp. C25]|nr:hypothetical protein [Acidithrix sp. C25]
MQQKERLVSAHYRLGCITANSGTGTTVCQPISIDVAREQEP